MVKVLRRRALLQACRYAGQIVDFLRVQEFADNIQEALRSDGLLVVLSMAPEWSPLAYKWSPN